MWPPLAALGVSATGAVATAWGYVAAAAEPAAGGGIAPYVQGGGSAAAVGGLVYVARLIAKGELVPRPVKDAEAELGAGILAAAQREDRVLKVAEAQQKLLERLETKFDASLVLQTEVRAALDSVAREMAYWREMRDRGTRRGDGPLAEDRR